MLIFLIFSSCFCLYFRLYHHISLYTAWATEGLFDFDSGVLGNGSMCMWMICCQPETANFSFLDVRTEGNFGSHCWRKPTQSKQFLFKNYFYIILFKDYFYRFQLLKQYFNVIILICRHYYCCYVF